MKKFLTLLTLCSFFIHNATAHNFQEHTSRPLQQNTILRSLQEDLKDVHYRKEILPNNFSYLTDLIVYGNNTQQPPTYLRSVIKMFANILKGADYVSAYAFSDLIQTFPVNLKDYFVLRKSRSYITNEAILDAHMYDRFNQTVNSALYLKFSNEYDEFKRDPNSFLQTISNEIVGLAQEEFTRGQIRQDIIRFCEIALSKMIWNPQDHIKTWDITKKISNQLASLLEHNILDDVNDLDDLYWTLLHRYCYFIELTHTDMPLHFFDDIKNDINSQKSILFALEEQDLIVAPKIECFKHTLMHAEAQARSYHRKS